MLCEASTFLGVDFGHILTMERHVISLPTVPKSFAVRSGEWAR